MTAKDERNRTILHNAAMRGDSALVSLLLYTDISVNELDNNNYSALGIALREEKFKIAYKLLQHPDINIQIGGGIFGHLINLAVVKLDVQTVERLIGKNA